MRRDEEGEAGEEGEGGGMFSTCMFENMPVYINYEIIEHVLQDQNLKGTPV